MKYQCCARTKYRKHARAPIPLCCGSSALAILKQAHRVTRPPVLRNHERTALHNHGDLNNPYQLPSLPATDTISALLSMLNLPNSAVKQRPQSRRAHNKQHCCREGAHVARVPPIRITDKRRRVPPLSAGRRHRSLVTPSSTWGKDALPPCCRGTSKQTAPVAAMPSRQSRDAPRQESIPGPRLPAVAATVRSAGG